MLRKSQVAMVRDFAENIRSGKSIVKQMIMGAGKTTVVAPLLTLMFGDGKSLVMEVVPPALLEFSRSIMRSTFSTVMYKRVSTFHFDRASIPHPSMLTKLRAAVAARGVVISTPTSVKSVMLKLLETQQQLKDLTLPRTRELEHERDVLVALLREFQKGVLLMDEVDMILHPLKSELNFPIGAKHELDFDPLRWRLAMHVLDAVYYHATPVVPADFRDSKAAVALLEQISAAVRVGLSERHMQSSPHVVLLNADFYYATLLPLMCDWVMLWVEAQHLTGITSAQLREYLLTSGVHNAELTAAVETGVTPHFRKMMNLARDWLRSYLPHVLQKIDRVGFGLLSKEDYERAVRNDPNIPETRAKLAIPFLGKDVPSETSEFAHPDVIIGLTYMAYRYEGLRYTDFCEVIDSLHSSLGKELGPYIKRPTVARYARWVREAGGVIRGEASAPAPSAVQQGLAALQESKEQGEDEEDENLVVDKRVEVMPLRLLKRSNVDHMQALFNVLVYEPLVIQWYLNDFVFPAHLRHQKVKLSASGVEIGGDMLFSRRVGFSGTPSDLLPLELGQCDYEKGTDGMMVHVLTSPDMVGFSRVEEDWSVRSLLRRVATDTDTATGNPMFQSLIDTGALITGFSNKGVAEYLLEHGLVWADGVVFLDELDRKMVLVRATKRVVKLAQCGIPADKRFAFYDQVHTTGMDILHRLDARAAITLGKDMTFRDYAQGAYRMRGLSKGQTIHLLVTPEIDRLVQRQLAKAGGLSAVVRAPAESNAAFLQAVVAWLVINSMQSEHTQFNQLAIQNVTNVWRKNAFNDLLCGAGYFGLDAFPLDAHVAAEYRAKNVRMARQAKQQLKDSGEVPESRVQRKNEARAARRRIHKQRIAIRAEFLAKVRTEGGSAEVYRNAMPGFKAKVEELLLSRRKEVFTAMLRGYSEDVVQDIVATSKMVAAATESAFTAKANPALESALAVFEETVNFTLADCVPKLVPFNESLQQRIENNKQFIHSSAESAVCADTVASVMRSAGDTLQMLALTAEMVQTVEEERERAVEQEQESEIEIEKFVDLSYSRDNEHQVPWPLSRLRFSPEPRSEAEGGEPFYPASAFTVPGAAGIALPTSLFLSTNYFDRRWSGARRIKNATMYIEYVPRNSGANQTQTDSALSSGALTSWLSTTGDVSLAQRLETNVGLSAQLATAFKLLDRDGSGDLNEEETAHFISAVTTDRIDCARVQAGRLLRALGTTALSLKQAERILCEGALHPAESGRYFVCLSLREAESLRWWMHRRSGKSLIDGADVDVVLRCNPGNNMVIDRFATAPAQSSSAPAASVALATHTLTEARELMSHAVWQALRYFNCETYFSTADINALLSVLDVHGAAARLKTFSAVQACRRRARRKWHETPVARLFNTSLDSRLHAIKLRAMSFCLRTALRSRNLSVTDAFRAFDANRNGLLSPDEMLGGVTWLGLDADISLMDVVGLVGLIDRRDGNLQLKDFGDLLRDPSLVDDRVGARAELDAAAATAAEAEADEIGGLDDADLPAVPAVRTAEILAAWTARSAADLVGSTADASSGAGEATAAADSASNTAADHSFMPGVTVGRNPESRETWLEIDLSYGIPSCVTPVGNTTFVPADAPGNTEKIGYVKCSNLGGFNVTIPPVGPFKQFPATRSMSMYVVSAFIRLPSLPAAKARRGGAALKKRRPLFYPSVEPRQNANEVGLFNSNAGVIDPSASHYDQDALPINSWLPLVVRSVPSMIDLAIYNSNRNAPHWGTFNDQINGSFAMFHTPSSDVLLGAKSPGHEIHVRSIILRSSSWMGDSISEALADCTKKFTKWACSQCAHVNNDVAVCVVCIANKKHPGSSDQLQRSTTCTLCFHNNFGDNDACERCHTALNRSVEDEDAVDDVNVDDGLGGEGDVDAAEGDLACEGDGAGEGDGADEGDESGKVDGDDGVIDGDDADTSKKTDVEAEKRLTAVRAWQGGAVGALLKRMNMTRRLNEEDRRGFDSDDYSDSVESDSDEDDEGGDNSD